MQPGTPRAYALAVPDRRLAEETNLGPSTRISHRPRRCHCRRRPQAHAADLKAQGAHDVQYLRYWVSEAAGRIFCVAGAPSAEAANTMHREAHGLVAGHLLEVLGRAVTQLLARRRRESQAAV